MVYCHRFNGTSAADVSIVYFHGFYAIYFRFWQWPTVIGFVLSAAAAGVSVAYCYRFCAIYFRCWRVSALLSWVLYYLLPHLTRQWSTVMSFALSTSVADVSVVYCHEFCTIYFRIWRVSGLQSWVLCCFRCWRVSGLLSWFCAIYFAADVSLVCFHGFCAVYRPNDFSQCLCVALKRLKRTET